MITIHKQTMLNADERRSEAAETNDSEWVSKTTFTRAFLCSLKFYLYIDLARPDKINITL